MACVHCALCSTYFTDCMLQETMFCSLHLRGGKQGWEFAHSLIAHLLISLKSNERLWTICSDRSRQMSNHERIAQVAQDKWATLRNSLRSLRGNEQMSDSLKKFWLKKSKILFYYVLFKV